MPNKTVANLRINAPEYGMNDSFEIEDTAARAAADAAASTAASTAATVQTMGTRLTAVETKNTQQDTAIANAVEAIAGKTQMYTTAGGVNTPYPQLRIGTGLSVDNGVLSATGGGGDISALTARVAALETNDGIQDTDIDNLQTAMTAAQGDIGALETNDGIQDTDIDNLQTAMTAAQGAITGLDNGKTKMYTTSGGVDTVYKQLQIGTGLDVTNGVLSATGGGGGGGFTQCTAIADANDATTPGLYCPASSSATHFPGNRTNYNDGTLIVTSYATSGDGNIVQQMYIENPQTVSQGSSANPKIWTRVKYQSEDWFTPGTFTYTWTKWNMVAQGASLAQSPDSAADGTSVICTNSAGSDYPAEFLNDEVYGVIITTTSPNAATASFQAGQVLITWESTEAKVFIRIKYNNTWSAWAKVAGGGNSLPDQTTYTTFGNGKRMYVTDTEPTGSDIPLGSVWIGGDA